MDLIEQLAKKAQQAADQLLSLKKENKQLTSEVQTLRGELKEYHHVLRENEKFRRVQDKVRSKLEKIDKKLQRSMTSDSKPVFSVLGESNERASK